KTKPTQHSVKELRSIGIQPDVLVCRCQKAVPEGERKKIALFTSVAESSVIISQDLPSIYQIPLALQAQGLDDIVLRQFGRDAPPAQIEDWIEVVHKQANPKREIRLGLVGKYIDLADAYISLNESISHAGISLETKVHVTYIDSERLETEGLGALQDVDCIIVAGGFGKRGVEGKIKAAQYARVNKVPYLGICLGMQVALIEYARHMAGLENANSTEFNPETPYPVVALVTEWLDEDGQKKFRAANTDMGGTMRLGAQTCLLEPDSLAYRCYQQPQIVERHRHRYEVNGVFVEALEAVGLKVSGYSQDRSLVEMVELPDHPWYLGCQFHPEFLSKPRKPHPLFVSFIRAGSAYHEQK
ncbi:MAG: CTP synthase, partial [Pseudomonadota bacterium]